MRARRGADEGYNFWPVYSDLALSMLLVLLLFLLAQFVFNSRLLIEQDFARSRVRVLQQSIRRELQNVPGVERIEENGNLQIITLSADFLFPTDQATLTPQGAQLLGQLSRTIRRAERRYTRVAVEGHADFRPSAEFYRQGDLNEDHGNWRLSAERAIQVVQRFQSDGLDGGKLEVVGRSGYAPVDTAYRKYSGYAGEEERERHPEYEHSLQRNRRIVIRLFYSERQVGSTS
jgi:outer membrane protein OmpA-like peptidoglycan-associated protein